MKAAATTPAEGTRALSRRLPPSALTGCGSGRGCCSSLMSSGGSEVEGKLPLLERVVLGWRLGIGSEPVSVEGIAAHLGLAASEIEAIERRARVLAADSCP